MHVTLCDGVGRRIEAIVLAAGARHLRAVLPGQSDTVELELAGSCWVSESGDCFEIDSALFFAEEEEVPAMACGGGAGH
jgi:hypothetical protein